MAPKERIEAVSYTHLPPRTVDIESDRCRYVIDNLLSYVGPADYEAARRYVPDPENYDLYNILEWERP